MTNDHTPLELSCCWKSPSQNGIPIPRYIFEIAPSDGRTRASSLRRGISAIQALEMAAARRAHDKACHNLDVHLFPELWRQLAQTMLANDAAIHNGHCPACGPASTLIGFDVSPSTIKTKFYWLLPSCLTNTHLLSLLDSIFVEASAAANACLAPSFLSAWSMIKAYLSSVNSSVRLRMLSVDATKYPTPRIKLYVRCFLQADTLDFSYIVPYLTLNGKLALDPDFEQTCRRLWTCLIRSVPASAPKPKYVLVLYDFASTEVSSKLYIMCQELPLSDAVIATALLGSCEAMKGSLLLARLAHQENATAYINEIGLAPRAETTEAAIYLNPCFLSSKKWRDKERGGDQGRWMEKKRIARPEM
jgi:Tryptophan dimethylallyltransferase